MFMAHSRSFAPCRHARPCAEHLRTCFASNKATVDGQDEPGHDRWASTYSRHCHGKLRQIKPEQIGRPAKTLLPSDRVESLQPILHRLTEVITALAERAVALFDEVALL